MVLLSRKRKKKDNELWAQRFFGSRVSVVVLQLTYHQAEDGRYDMNVEFYSKRESRELVNGKSSS